MTQIRASMIVDDSGRASTIVDDGDVGGRRLFTIVDDRMEGQTEGQEMFGRTFFRKKNPPIFF